MDTKHTPGPWHVGSSYGNDSASIVTEDGKIIGAIKVKQLVTVDKGHPVYSWSDELAANASLIAAAPELKSVSDNFEITGPDDDGFVWLVLHGNGTTGKAMFNLGKADMLAVQVALHLESDRRAAISKSTGKAA